jgi:hypothetical protein
MDRLELLIAVPKVQRSAFHYGKRLEKFQIILRRSSAPHSALRTEIVLVERCASQAKVVIKGEHT